MPAVMAEETWSEFGLGETRFGGRGAANEAGVLMSSFGFEEGEAGDDVDGVCACITVARLQRARITALR